MNKQPSCPILRLILTSIRLIVTVVNRLSFISVHFVLEETERLGTCWTTRDTLVMDHLS